MRRRAALLGLLLAWGLPAHAAGGDYGALPAPAGGDILRVSMVTGPQPGSFWANARLSTRADSLESFRCTTFALTYGLSPTASFGIATSHYFQDRGFGDSGIPINKQGPGDTRMFFKWRAPTTERGPLFLGLRPSLRLPTGYDRNAAQLVPFTSGTLDFELLGLISFETPLMGVHLNPGISLPGGKWHNELLAGLGFDIRGGLPLGLLLKGEYFTRFDIPTETFRHEIFGTVGHALPLARLALEVGLQKRLVEGESTGPQLTMRLGLGRPDGHPLTMARPPRSRPLRILVPPVATAADDPLGMGPMLRATLVREIARHDGLSANTAGSGEYTAQLKLVSILESTGRSISIPKILATPRATIEITALLTLTDAHGERLVDHIPLSMNLSRGMGVALLPTSGDEDTWVPSAQTRAALRNRGLRKLAGRAAKVAAQVVVGAEREAS